MLVGILASCGFVAWYSNTLLSTPSASATNSPPRRPPSPNHAWKRAHANRPPLAGLDISRVIGGAGHLTVPRWSRYHVDLHERRRLYHRHLSHYTTERIGSQYDRQKRCSSWLALGGAKDVRRFRHRVGSDAAGGSVYCMSAGTMSVLRLW